MRALTGHEKKLTFLLLGALTVGVHLILLKFALQLDRSNRRQLAQAVEELTEARFWIGQREQWQERIDWLEINFRSVPEQNPAPGLQKILQGAATSAGLTVEEQKPPTPKPGSRYVEYSSRMKMSGSLGQFLDWLVKVYRPGDGIAVTSLNLKIGPEPPKMTGEVGVGQFFRPNNP